MPYITQDRRFEIDKHLVPLIGKLKFLKDKSHSKINAGDLNYVMTKLILATEAKDYAALNEVVGALECCKAEFQRRLVGPYEDKKSAQNGDVY